MSNRDDLANLIEEVIDFDIDQIADTILKAGWRPPARTIEPAEELDALPYGTVIRDSDGDVCEAIGRDCSGGMRWIETGWSDERESVTLPPATILWEPGDGDE